MKKILLAGFAALVLTACATVEDEKVDEEKAECAVLNPDGSCACKVVDDNGDCIEGGGPGIIIRSGN